MSNVAMSAGKSGCFNDIAESTPVSRFINHGNGTVTDKKTGLTWMQCAIGQAWDGESCNTKYQNFSWPGALKSAQTFNDQGGFAEAQDWRVPNLKELASIIEQRCHTPALNKAVFPNALGMHFWSSTPHAAHGGGSWGVSFERGGACVSSWNTPGRVRLVRG